MRPVKRVYKIDIKPNDKGYAMFLDFCHKSKNLYNATTYIERQCIFNKTKILGNYQLSKILQDREDYPDYKDMPTAQSAQQTIKQVYTVWKSYLKALKEYKKNPSKFTGKPRLPKYKEKDGYFPITFTNQNCKYKDGYIHFPRVCNGYKLKFDISKIENFRKLSEVKIVPKVNKLVVFITYTKDIYDVDDRKSKKILGVDIGLNNFSTCVSNTGDLSFIINGRNLKSINRFYNKEITYYKSILEKTTKRKISNKLKTLQLRRNNKVLDFIHKSTKKIVDLCKENNIDTIVIGYNKQWKDNDITSKKFNQNFNQVPFYTFINILKYKCEDANIKMITTEESYTSGTSFVDKERPIKEYYNKSRRIKRGLFKSNEDVLINADVNSAYQIINKVFRCEYQRGFLLHAMKYNIM